MVVQLVRISACHAEGRGFESRPLRQTSKRALIEKPVTAFLLPWIPGLRSPLGDASRDARDDDAGRLANSLSLRIMHLLG